MMEWNPATISNAESAALAKHILAFFFAVIFFVYLLSEIKHCTTQRASSKKLRIAIVLDIAFYALFLSLIITSVILLLSPYNALSFTDAEQQPATLCGSVSEQYLRPYLWAPSTKGSCIIIGEKQLYLSGLHASIEGTTAELTYLPGTAYALSLSSVVPEMPALSYPWYLHFCRVLMLVSGVYLIIRLGQVAACEALHIKKQRDKSNPLIQFLDHL